MGVIATGLDYSARRLSGASVRAAGYKFVNRYLDFSGQQWPPLTAGELLDLEANGIEVHAVYEQNTNDPAGGYPAGVAMGRQAVQSARAAGLPAGTTIFMCADSWLANHSISVGTAMSFLDGARTQIDPAGFVIGAYGFADFIFAAHDGGHADRFWLCGAEIPDDHRPDWLHMYQWNNGRVFVDGLSCDLNKQYLPMDGGDELSWDKMFADPDTGTDHPAWAWLVYSNKKAQWALEAVQALLSTPIPSPLAQDVDKESGEPRSFRLVDWIVHANLKADRAANASEAALKELGGMVPSDIEVSKEVVDEALQEFFARALPARPEMPTADAPAATPKD